MKKFRFIFTCIILMALSFSAHAQVSFGQAEKFNGEWLFDLSDEAAASSVEFDDSKWRKLDLPHDWSIEGQLSPSLASCTGFLPGGIAWYRKHFTVTDSQPRHYIYFEGVYNRSEVYLNGHLLGKRPNGYISFMYDMTPYLKEGDNVIAVRVDHSRYADSRWYTGSGIYRDVWMIAAPEIHFAQWGVGYTLSRISGKKAEVEVNIAVEKHVNTADRLETKVSIYDRTGKKVASATGRLNPADSTKTLKLSIASPHRWDISDPYLYRMEAELLRAGKTVDRCQVNMGLRTLEFNADKGFALNGNWMKVKGVCLHHDAGVLGSVVPEEVWRRRLENLKGIGVNAIRMSHNPQAPVVYDLCDELGLLVMDEASDEWEFPKRKWIEGWNVGTPGFDGTYDFFEEWIERDVTDMVRRDRNHPSIFLWSIGNEVDYPNDPYSHPILNGSKISQPMFGGYDPEAPNAERIGKIAKRLAACVRAVDTSRPVTGALAGVVMSNETEYPEAVDVVGYNYTEDRYDLDHKTYPDRIIYGSENRPDIDAWYAVRDKEFIFGQFIWTGTDYLGESSPWPARGFYTGLLDFGSFVKPRGHFRASLWSDKPVTYIGTYPKAEYLSVDAWDIWNYEPGQDIRVVCYTNAPQARLLLDGNVIGEMKPYDPKTGIIHWDVPYQDGELKAEGCDENGNVVSTYSIKSSGRPYALRVSADKTNPSADGETIHLTVEVVDENGTVVKLGDNEITCTVDGPARLLGLEGSDNRDMSDYTDNVHRAYHGRLLAYIQTTGEPGTVKVKFTSPLLKGTEIILDVMVSLSSIELSDPAILADHKTGMYYMTGTRGKLWKSRDLAMWSGPYDVVETDTASWMGSDPEIWAAELHSHNGKYYYFATFTNHDAKADAVTERRASHVLVSDSPEGPYRPMKDPVYLPAEKSTLDGTFWVDSDGKPYMVYCHEWIQNHDGTIEKIELKPDLSGTVGEGKILFRASDSPWSRENGDIVRPNMVTDGPYLFRCGSGRLGMIWTSWIKDIYTQGVAYSQSGTLDGPWIQEKEPITPPDFGHGMIFRTFDNRLLMAVHSHKNIDGYFYRVPHLFNIDISGDKLVLGEEYKPSAKDEKYSAYLFAYFTGNEKEQEAVHLAISHDGYDFRALNGNRPVLDSKAVSSTGGVRDPHILRAEKDSVYYMTLTDMTSSKGWDSNRAMVMLKSYNLVDWTASVINIQEKYAGHEDLKRVWAPETIFDKEAGKYMVYWSMQHGNGPDIIYYAYANDSFTDLEGEPAPLFIPKDRKSCIDGNIVYKDGLYHLFYKTEGHGNGIKAATTESLTSGKWNESPGYKQQTDHAVEGSSIFKRIGEDRFVMMYDVYMQGGYQFTETYDLRDFRIMGKDVRMDFHPRHGCIIPITSEEVKRLTGKWGNPFAGTNPILPGFHADPEIMYSHNTGKYYIYSTTDGVPGWGGKHFNAFSSDDLKTWKDEGTVLDLGSEQVPWADGNAWAPAIEEKLIDGKYRYFLYYSGNQKNGSGKAIGVAVSDSPTGPFTDYGMPMITDSPTGYGQQIDVDVFTDPVSGKSYLYWGNGYMAGAELNEDMTSIRQNTLTVLTPDGGTLADYAYREAPYIIFRNGTYYFFWSVDDTGSPNYHVAYGTSDSPSGPIKVAENPVILSQAPEKGVFGPAHNAILNIPGTDCWYIVYHRISKNYIEPAKSPGTHREVCISPLHFNADGTIAPVIP